MTIRYVFCDARQTIDVEAWDGHRRRRSWRITYLDPKALAPDPVVRRTNRLRDRLRGLIA